MKQLTVIILVLIASFQSVSQSMIWEGGDYLYDSIIVKESIPGFWESTTNKEVFQYNIYNDVKLHEIYSNVHWFPYSVDWKKTEKSIYSYDEQGMLLNMIREKRAIDKEEWTMDYMSIITFEGNDSIQTSYHWIDDRWKKGARWTYTWNPENDESITLWQTWNKDNNNWNNIQRFDTIYTSSGIIDTIKFFIWWEQEEMDTASIEAFDYTYYPDTIISHYFHNGLIDIVKQFHNSAINADVKVTVRNLDSLNNSLPVSKRLFYLDENQNVVQDILQLWNPMEDQWEINAQVDYGYNSSNLLDEMIRYFPNGSEIIFEKRNYSYNSDLLLSKQTVYFHPVDPESYTMYDYYYVLKYVDVLEDPTSMEIKAWPNPANNMLFIDNSVLTYQYFSIFSFYGKLVKTGKLYRENELVDISKLSVGNYMLILHGKSTVHSQQFIKIR